MVSVSRLSMQGDVAAEAVESHIAQFSLAPPFNDVIQPHNRQYLSTLWMPTRRERGFSTTLRPELTIPRVFQHLPR